jgi:hypothetical protein
MISIRNANDALPHGECGELPPATPPRHAWLSIIAYCSLAYGKAQILGEVKATRSMCPTHPKDTAYLQLLQLKTSSYIAQ